ncbi:hypothetical protein EVAR_103199_1 [Eumeta japonica]|uniref:Uncharacterized protein n=1 Tax=Eumeta variegata TaxID=151549 RepID=A0A4C1YCC1_EUMVA|nr:hypothetical protein EVAR_103199_1 [Eumeta japonica]
MSSVVINKTAPGRLGPTHAVSFTEVTTDGRAGRPAAQEGGHHQRRGGTKVNRQEGQCHKEGGQWHRERKEGHWKWKAGKEIRKDRRGVKEGGTMEGTQENMEWKVEGKEGRREEKVVAGNGRGREHRRKRVDKVINAIGKMVSSIEKVVSALPLSRKVDVVTFEAAVVDSSRPPPRPAPRGASATLSSKLLDV